MGQDVRMRKQVTVNFTANSTVNESLGRGMVYRELYLRLRGAPTLLAANNTQAKTKKGDEWGVVKLIRIIANNTEVIQQFTGNQLWWLNYFMFGCRPVVQPTIGDGATANPAFDSCLILPFWQFRSVRPMDTALDARRLSDLKVEIQWGTYTDINGDASAWTTEPYVDVHSLECSNIQGNFATSKIYPLEKTISATSSNFQIDLPVGHLYRGFVFNTEDGADTDAGSILNNMKIVSGTTIFSDVPNVLMQQIHGWQRSNIDNPFDAGAGASGVYDECRRGTTYNKRAGWRFYDHVTDGRLSEAIDTAGFSEFKLELDVTVGAGTTKIIVIPLTIIPVRGKGK